MIIRGLFFAFLTICLAVFISFGKDHGKKLNKGGAILIEAYTQRIIPGQRESRIVKETHFIINWQNKDYPKSFIWLDGGDTMKCSITRAHKINAGNTRRLSGMPDYYSENITLNKIKKGDTLDISPGNIGSTILPSDLPKNRKNTLLYVSGNKTSLHGFQVDSIAKKQDIVMP